MCSNFEYVVFSTGVNLLKNFQKFPKQFPIVRKTDRENVYGTPDFNRELSRTAQTN